MASEDWLEVWFVGLVVGGNYVWCLIIVVMFMGFGQVAGKKYRGSFKIINWGGNASHKRGAIFIERWSLTM